MPTTQVTPTEDALLQGIADALLKARKVVVITGAGISTNSGIPDFRSENGLYSLIQAQYDAAAAQDDTPRPTCTTPSDTTPDERGHPNKRRKLSFEDSGICMPSDGSQPTIDNAVDVKDETKWAAQRESSPITADGPITRSRSRRSSPNHSSQQPTPPMDRVQKRSPSMTSERSLRRSRRTQSLPPTDSPPKKLQTLRKDPSPKRHVPTGSPTPTPLRSRFRSTSPDTTRRSNTHQAPAAELRKRSLLTSSLASMQASEVGGASITASDPARAAPSFAREDEPILPLARRALASASHLTTPKKSRTFPTSSPLSSPPSVLPQTPTFCRGDGPAHSTLSRPLMTSSSSPLSSPPPDLFDPYEERSSLTSQQTSSAVSSAASSETDETPPSSQPGKPSLPNIKGRDLFDASIWADPLRTSVFYRFATNLRQKVRDVQPTESHHFIGHLRNRGKLVRCYTQNIDQIEEKVGLSTSLQEGPGHRGRFSRKSMVATLAPTSSQGSEKGSCGNVESPEKETRDVRGKGSSTSEGTAAPTSSQTSQTERKPSGVECVFLHGSLESLRCFLCGKICAWDEGGRAQETLFGRQPECPFCAGATAARQERGKRALGVGKLRPDIVLYGEEHPNAHLISPIVTHDLGLQPDLLLILGTSLKVHGLKVLVREFARTIHGRGGKVVFVNFTKPPESSWRDIIDYWVQWDCDAWVSDLKARVPLLWQPPGIKPPKKKKEPSEKQKKRQSLAVERPKPTPAGLPEGVEISAPASSAVVSENLDQVDQLGTSGETATSPEETGSRFASDKGVPASTPALCVPQVVVPETLGIADEPAVAAELPISVELVVPEDTGRSEQRMPFEMPIDHEQHHVEAQRLVLRDLAVMPAATVIPGPSGHASTTTAKEVGPNPPPPTHVFNTQPKLATMPEAPTEVLLETHLALKTPAKHEIQAVEATPKSVPSRPAATRDDRMNAAWLSWRIRSELRRIVGRQPTTTRVTKAKPKHRRKSAPGVSSEVIQYQARVNAQDVQQRLALPVRNAEERLQPLDAPLTFDAVMTDASAVQPSGTEPLGVEAQEADVQETETQQAEASGSALLGPQTMGSSILAAVKHNPRKRKRKTIDGIEISAVRTPRSTAAATAKALPRPAPLKAKMSPNEEEPLMVPPDVLSGIHSVTMSRFELAPLHRAESEVAMPTRLAPMEPDHTPAGPLADISPNSRPRFQHDAMPSTASCYQQRSTPYSPPESQQSFTPHSAPFVQQNFALKPLSHFQHNSTADAQSHVEQHATLNRPPYLEQNSSPSLPVHVQQNFAPHPLSHFQHNSIRVEQHATPTQPSYLGQNFTLSSPTEAQHNFAPTLLCHFQQNPTPDYRPIVEQRTPIPPSDFEQHPAADAQPLPPTTSLPPLDFQPNSITDAQPFFRQHMTLIPPHHLQQNLPAVSPPDSQLNSTVDRPCVEQQAAPSALEFTCDATIRKLMEELNWTASKGTGPIKMFGTQRPQHCEREAEAALALEGMRHRGY